MSPDDGERRQGDLLESDRGLVDRGPEVMADCQLNMVGHLFVKRRPIVMYQKMVNAVTCFS